MCTQNLTLTVREILTYMKGKKVNRFTSFKCVYISSQVGFQLKPWNKIHHSTIAPDQPQTRATGIMSLRGYASLLRAYEMNVHPFQALIRTYSGHRALIAYFQVLTFILPFLINKPDSVVSKIQVLKLARQHQQTPFSFPSCLPSSLLFFWCFLPDLHCRL